uniref:Uncharacterized protein n=1 Tax=Euplotes crassus TaxID=5936 RepID=A0A7S3KAL7_EUPCR|mmetsp:Transcript_17830/g.17551  ORF Transcript_17830/g.17551 Transcript_17830/m.17551 type:complete len:177 (+) Transcript_17830:13-543(+)
MKYSLVLAFLFIGAVICAYDYSHHQDGHELTVALRDETEKAWVIFVESNGEGDDADKLRAQNKQVKSAVKNSLYNEDIFYTELDLTTEDDQKKYKEFTDLAKLDLELLKEGPTVVLVYDKKGYWIHGAGIPQETVDTVHSFIIQKQESDNRNQPISIGGPVKHPSSYQSFGGGYSR